MKNTIYIIIYVLFFWSCQSDNFETVGMTEQTAECFDSNVTYPMDVTTRSTDELSTSWETLDEIILPSGKPVYTPWNTNYSKSTIPAEYSNDIKKVDGWNLIAHTVNGKESGLNYLFFYNRYTGTLKVFYYLEHSFPQTTGLWHIYIDKPQNLLAFTNSIAYTMDSSHKIQDVYCRNITINKDKAFTEGWNCFELELAYDPYFKTGTLTIEPCGIIQSNLTITGDYNSKSDGSIVTLNAEKKGVQKGTGSDAKKYITNEVPKVSREFGNLSSLTESSPLSDFVQKGVGKLFKSFSALTKKQKPQEYKLQFTTHGSVNLNGDIKTNLGGGFSPVKINISNDKVGKLGLWNLSEQPTIQFNTLGRHIATSDVTFPTFRIYGAGKEFYSIYINSDATNGILGYSHSYQVFIGDNSECLSPGGTLSGSILNYNAPKSPLYFGLSAKRAVEFKVYFPGIDNHNPQLIPKMIYLYGSKNDYEESFQIVNEYLFKVTLDLNVDNNIKISSTKTFKPLLEWRTDNLEENKQLVDEPDAKFILMRK